MILTAVCVAAKLNDELIISQQTVEYLNRYTGILQTNLSISMNKIHTNVI